MTKIKIYFILHIALQFLPSSSFAIDPETVRFIQPHSIANLGSQFSTPVPMIEIDNARLVLLNEPIFELITESMGIPSPKTYEEKEQLILKLFARVVASPGEEASEVLPSTFYTGSSRTGHAGEANGDGRVIWHSELQFHQIDDRIAYLDLLIKGIGQTPNAWTNHPDEQHRDGLLSMREAVHSFIMSEANRLNHLNSPVDVAVIEIPNQKLNSKTGQYENAAISIRLGNQTRIAHLDYHSKNQNSFRTLANYIVNRSLGYASNHEVTLGDVEDYLYQFARHLGIEAARYNDLHLLHGSPTSGNFTTNGGMTDLGTLQYLDAHHEDLRYFANHLTYGNQTFEFLSQIRYVLYSFQKSNYFPFVSDLENVLIQIFEETKKQELTQLWLERLGLNKDLRSLISSKTKRKFYDATLRLFLAKGDKKKDVGAQKIFPAKYDMRNVFSKVIKTIDTLGKTKNKNYRIIENNLIESLFISDRSWATTEKSQIIGERKQWIPRYFVKKKLSHIDSDIRDFLQETKNIYNTIMELEPRAFPKVIQRAESIHYFRRNEPTAPRLLPEEEHLVNKIQNGTNYNFQEVSEKALQISANFSDTLSERTFKSPVHEVLASARNRMQSRTCQNLFLPKFF